MRKATCFNTCEAKLLIRSQHCIVISDYVLQSAYGSKTLLLVCNRFQVIKKLLTTLLTRKCSVNPAKSKAQVWQEFVASELEDTSWATHASKALHTITRIIFEWRDTWERKAGAGSR